jgi:polyisoprenoid-binding protein YceI
MAVAQSVAVDTGRSSLTIHVEKSGLFSAFAHNHTIQAPIASGQLDAEKRVVAMTFNAKEMKVVDEGVKESELADIDQTMKSDKVLDVQRFPEIRFVSTRITPQDGGRYQVRGDLTLHGVTKPVDLPVTFAHDRYNGSVKLKQTDFGIAPISIAGGTVKVKDVIEVVFEIVPGRN